MSATTLSTLRMTFAPAAMALLAGVVALGLLFYPECKAAVGVWIASTAYGHCFLIIPMSLYLAWDRRDALAGMMARPEPVWAVLAATSPLAAALLVGYGYMQRAIRKRGAEREVATEKAAEKLQ